MLDVASKTIKIYVPSHMENTHEAQFKWSDLNPAQLATVQGDSGWSISLLDMEPEPVHLSQPTWSPLFDSEAKEDDDLQF